MAKLPKTITVRKHTRKNSDGSKSKVRTHKRSAPDGIKSNNHSYKG